MSVAISEEKDFYGFREIDFKWRNKDAVLVFPENPCDGKKILLKTEYFGAFPDFELEMLKRGYHLAHIKCKTRWCLESDTEDQADFVKFLHTEFGTSEKCVPVGMSCGGMQALFLCAKHPECVSVAYLDAPVVNLLSCPGGFGKGNDSMMPEFTENFGLTKTELLAYRKSPIDYTEKLTENKIPLYIIAGDSDATVPFDENGEYIYNAYKKAGIPVMLYLKKDAGHHPHGPVNTEDLISFIIKYDI